MIVKHRVVGVRVAAKKLGPFFAPVRWVGHPHLLPVPGSGVPAAGLLEETSLSKHGLEASWRTAEEGTCPKARVCIKIYLHYRHSRQETQNMFTLRSTFVGEVIRF